MKREPVETMSRMALMQELAEWRRRGPALLAVARAAERHRLRRRPVEMPRAAFLNEEHACLNSSDTEATLHRALARLRRLSPGRRKP